MDYKPVKNKGLPPLTVVSGAVVMALAAGYVLGTLFAPKSGKYTRNKLRRKAKEIGDNINKAADDIEEKAKELKR
jgi:gas vesicle protein